MLKIDRRTLPKSHYTDRGFEVRQVVDFEVTLCVTEYRAQVLVDAQGKRYVASFPAHAKRPIQYGANIKANSVYFSQYQLLPYARLENYFIQQAGLPISAGSLFNFNKEAYEVLEEFETIAKHRLMASRCLHADETGVNIGGKRLWLHTACNERWTHFYPPA